MEKGTPAVDVTLMDGSTATLLSGESFSVIGNAGDRLTVSTLHPKVFFQTGAAGEYVGFGAVYLGERKIGEIPLLWEGESQ